MNLLLVALAFLCGSLPFSVWIGRLVLGADIRRFGDANPGATNVLRAGGKSTAGTAAAGVALLLDFLKGAIPVGIAYLALGLSGWLLVAVAIAPVAGHAFSPFLRFKGGKAVAVTGGIWSGLTVWEGPLLSGLLLGFFFWLLPNTLRGRDGWAVMTALCGLLLYFVLTQPFASGWSLRPPLWIIVAVWLGNVLIVGWKHQHEWIKYKDN